METEDARLRDDEDMALMTDAGDSDVAETDENETGPTRRCAATGVRGEKDGMVRFVLSPDGVVTPDVDARLPGRGVWITADAAALATAVKKKAFARGFRRAVTTPDDLVARVAELLARRCGDLLGLARRSRAALAGYDQVEAGLKAGRVALLVQAADAAAAGRARLRALAGGRPEWSILTSAELGAPFGRDALVHVGVASGGVADRLSVDLARLGGLRGRTTEQEV